MDYFPMTMEECQRMADQDKVEEAWKRTFQAIAVKHYLDGHSCEECMHLEDSYCKAGQAKYGYSAVKAAEFDAVPVAERCIKMDCFSQQEVEEYKHIFSQYLTPEQMERVRWTWMEFGQVRTGRMAANGGV